MSQILSSLVAAQEPTADPGVTSEWWPGLVLVLVIVGSWAWWVHHRRQKRQGSTEESLARFSRSLAPLARPCFSNWDRWLMRSL